MKLNLKFALVALVALALSCSMLEMSDEDLARINAQADEYAALQVEMEEIREAIAAGLTDGNLDANALIALNDQLIHTGFKVDELIKAAQEPVEGKTDWAGIGLAVLGSLTGVRVMRGGASKGVLAGVAGLGKGSA